MCLRIRPGPGSPVSGSDNKFPEAGPAISLGDTASLPKAAVPMMAFQALG